MVEVTVDGPEVCGELILFDGPPMMLDLDLFRRLVAVGLSSTPMGERGKEVGVLEVDDTVRVQVGSLVLSGDQVCEVVAAGLVAALRALVS